MSTKKMLNDVVQLQAYLAKDGPGDKFKAMRACMVSIINLYKAQLYYEKTKEMNPGAYVQFFEPLTPLSTADRENLAKAIAVNKQIGKTLGEMKKAKAKTKGGNGKAKAKGKASKRSS